MLKPELLSDLEMINAIKAGNGDVIRFFYDRYATTLYKIIWCTVKDPNIAEKVLLQTFIFIIKDINDYDVKTIKLLNWMACAAKTLALEAVRQPVNPPEKL